VETLTGQAVALVSGRPTLLGPSQVITNRTRVDVLADSELRLCHYQTAREFPPSIIEGPAVTQRSPWVSQSRCLSDLPTKTKPRILRGLAVQRIQTAGGSGGTEAIRARLLIVSRASFREVQTIKGLSTGSVAHPGL
jgi:hypothetical protein